MTLVSAYWSDILDPERIPCLVSESVSNQVNQDEILDKIVVRSQRRCVEIMLEFIDQNRDNNLEATYPEWLFDFPTALLVGWAACPFRAEEDVKKLNTLIKRLYQKRIRAKHKEELK